MSISAKNFYKYIMINPMFICLFKKVPKREIAKRKKNASWPYLRPHCRVTCAVLKT